MADRVQISDSEWDVMEVIWEADAWTAADVIRRLGATHDWNHSTIRTLLARLVEKGALGYEVDGPRYIYRAALSRRQCVRQEGRSFVDKVFRGDVGALLMHFAQDAALEPDQIDELRSLLDEKQPRRRRKGKDR
jgi:BlaI family penicillinase repressor